MSTFKRARFQEAAVQHIVGRIRDKSGSRRMLLADEVGLGKTVVARGVIEKLLERRRSPLTVIYLCSNAEIAEQNRIKLDPNSRRPIGRVTELAMERPGKDAELLLYSFTPGTSLNEGTGLEWERRLLMYLLYRISGFHVWSKSWREFFICGAGSERWYERTTQGRLFEDFERKTSTGFQDELRTAWGDATLNGERVIPLLDRMVSEFDENSREARIRRNRMVAVLRGVMQRVALRHLNPDLVVLDEVQRFREVLDGAENQSHIAAELFARRAPVLILSATPYRALTLGHELADGQNSHHEDFFKTLEFLFDRDRDAPARIRGNLSKFGECLRKPELATQLDHDLLELKRKLEEDLTKVICRTERNWYVLDHRKGIDDSTGGRDELPSRGELEEYFRLHQTLAASHGMGQVTEFWKSAPSLLTFLDGKYALLRKLHSERTRVPRALLTRADDVSALAKRNHRISRVVDIALGTDDAPPMLWTAPGYTYYRDELFHAFRPRKLLVFSGWRFVPKAVAIIASRAATDRLGGKMEDPTQPLRFSDKKSFHVFDICFPSMALAEAGASAYLERRGDVPPDSQDIVDAAVRLLRARLEESGISVVPQGGDPMWRVVMRLEGQEGRAHRVRAAMAAWISADNEEGGSGTIVQHEEWAAEWLSENRSKVEISEARLKRLAFIAAFSPANCVLRALQSVYGIADTEGDYPAIASLCLGPMRCYFNRTHVQQIIRRHRLRPGRRQVRGERELGYAELVLRYARDAHFQAVMDEYVYLQRHAAQGRKVVDAVDQLEAVWTLSRGSPRTNGASRQGNNVHIKLEADTHATHFALAFGEDVSRDAGPEAEQEDSKHRKSVVREAFNSPFWPFVLATTSVGQEGLDFHLYCRDVLHWNLPSNPVDLEQREGRINRRDCLAIRESIAHDWPLSDRLLREACGGTERNPWQVVFQTIERHDEVQKYKHGLFPHWIYECRDPANSVRIQRHVPFFTTSRDAEKYERLKTGLALYRLVFGQVNQEDLLEDLHGQMKDFDSTARATAMRRLASYMLNLSPIGHEHALRHAYEEAEGLLAKHPIGDPIGKLLQVVTRMREDRPADLSGVSEELNGIVQFVERTVAAGNLWSTGLLEAVASLAYLRNPYDRVFDLHVEGGFADDIEIIKKAWTSLCKRRLTDTKPT